MGGNPSILCLCDLFFTIPPQLIGTLLNDRCYILQPDTLVDHIKFDHGYTAKSPAIVNVCAY